MSYTREMAGGARICQIDCGDDMQRRGREVSISPRAAMSNAFMAWTAITTGTGEDVQMGQCARSRAGL